MWLTLCNAIKCMLEFQGKNRFFEQSNSFLIFGFWEKTICDIFSYKYATWVKLRNYMIFFYFVIPARTLQCFCEGHCPDNSQSGTCETRPGGTCFASVEEVKDEITGQPELEYSFGCMAPEQGGGLLQVIFKRIFYGISIESNFDSLFHCSAK